MLRVLNIKSALNAMDEQYTNLASSLELIAEGMAPNTVSKECLQSDHNSDSKSTALQKPYKKEYVWRNIILMTLLHIFAVYGMYLVIMGKAKWNTVIFVHVIAILSSMGVQAGGHRFWSHRAYKAKLPLRIILAFFHIMSLQNDIYEWCRDHRAHHKYAETDADPHNAKRGFFFSHVGWLLVKKHPDVKEKGQKIDLSDLMADPVVRFQRKYYIPLLLLIWGAIPTVTPHLFWSESLWNGFFVCVMFRNCLTLNLTWLVNSAAHMWGTRPYNKYIEAREATVRHLLMGEGFHNYHHTFPWDYSASELGAFDVFNPATAFIDFFALIGWAYDRKVVSRAMIERKQQRSAKLEDIRDNRGIWHSLYEWVGGMAVFLVPMMIVHIFKLINS